jgi:hypothetical protein
MYLIFIPSLIRERPTWPFTADGDRHAKQQDCLIQQQAGHVGQQDLLIAQQQAFLQQLQRRLEIQQQEIDSLKSS